MRTTCLNCGQHVSSGPAYALMPVQLVHTPRCELRAESVEGLICSDCLDLDHNIVAARRAEHSPNQLAPREMKLEDFPLVIKM